MSAAGSTPAIRESTATGQNQPQPTYYGRPALKPSIYGWTTALYIFVGGLAGASQIIAVAVDLIGAPEASAIVITGRTLALLGAIAGGVLLILDLHTKRRFYSMLRIFRAASPMSIGTYVLLGFGFFSLLALAATPLEAQWLATASGIVAALFGLAMVSYPAALLAATSTPLWAACPRLLACRFTASSMASGGAALFIASWAAGSLALGRALAVLTALAAVVELTASIASELRYRSMGLDGPLKSRPWGPTHRFGVQLLGAALPGALFLYDLLHGSGAGPAALLAALLVLGGGTLMRGVILKAGNESARRPEDYFRFARPEPRQASS